MSDTPERLAPGLDKVDELAPGKGFLAAEVQAKSELPLSVLLNVGYKANKDWALFGNAYLNQEQLGLDVAARYKKHLDLYASGNYHRVSGTWSAEAGAKWNF